MKSLILTAVTFLMAGAVMAAEGDMSSTNGSKMMSKAECDAAMAACTDDACKQKLMTENGCTADMPAAQ